MIQQLLTHAIGAITVGSAVYFGVVFITGYPAWKARKLAATAPAPMPSIHDFTDDELVDRLVAPLAESPDFADDAELPLEPEWFEQLQKIIDAGDSNHQPEQAIAPIITDTVVPFQNRARRGSELNKLTSKQLRQECQKAGIRWRDVHGKNRHLSQSEMAKALLLTAAG